MQFITNGPDIPEKLLQAHEDNQVVFFCGAGISYPAKLMGFEDLARGLFKGLSPANEIQQATLDEKQFDTAIGLLELDLVDGRKTVRREMFSILQPNLLLPGALTTHEALLKLSKNDQGLTRLITTNFDRIFEVIIARDKLKIQRFHAPLLPVPKNNWSGLVYLHGLLPEEVDTAELDKLVVTSGDFGLAYLVERWAARFVSELFRNYTVCFVGYSLDDKILRYMMDALAADRLLGGTQHEMFAFVGFEDQEDEKRCRNQWNAKNVSPVLYNKRERHALLHNTLATWAEIYRDGVLGKERLITTYALARPAGSTQQEDFVGRVLWALCDKTGLPAKRFSEAVPAPSLDWFLETFTKKRFRFSDLNRFSVNPHLPNDDVLEFSLVNRPVNYKLAPFMSLCNSNIGYWDYVMESLANWLVRHLNDINLILWVVQEGGNLHQNFAQRVRNRLDHIADLESKGNQSELDQIRSNSPNGAPWKWQRMLWRMILGGQVQGHPANLGMRYWMHRLKQFGLNTTLQLELRMLLAPKVVLSEPFLSKKSHGLIEPVSIDQLVSWKIDLTAYNVKSEIAENTGQEWNTALPFLLGDFEQLLTDALALHDELGGEDPSNYHLPSINPDHKTSGYHEWVILIELLRDAWLAVNKLDPDRATIIARMWFTNRYPTFKRLALYAAQQGNIAPREWIDWFSQKDSELDSTWLWSVHTMRESMGLIAKQSHCLTPEERERLESEILKGPYDLLVEGVLEQDDFNNLVAQGLKNLLSSGGKLGDVAIQRLQDFNAKFDFGRDQPRTIPLHSAPRNKSELIEWLIQPVPRGPFYRDNWSDVCQVEFELSSEALIQLAYREIWPTERWKTALLIWRQEEFAIKSWERVSRLLEIMPDDDFHNAVTEIVWWLDAVSKTVDPYKDEFIKLCQRVMSCQFSPGALPKPTTDDAIHEALNHPIGLATQALLNLWERRELNDNHGLHVDLKPVFTQICEPIEHYRHGRFYLATNLFTLFRVDPEWTKENLLPHFEWTRPHASSMWQGFLWSPRIYQPLLSLIKNEFLETATHYNELGEIRHQYVFFLTHVALDPIAIISHAEFRLALSSLPQEGRDLSAQALVMALEGFGQRDEYFKNRVLPLLVNGWPKSKANHGPNVSESFARLAIAAGSAFPEALAQVEKYLSLIVHGDFIITRLVESGHCDQFPEASLDLLFKISHTTIYTKTNLATCLDQIVNANPDLSKNPRYKKLHEIGIK